MFSCLFEIYIYDTDRQDLWPQNDLYLLLVWAEFSSNNDSQLMSTGIAKCRENIAPIKPVSLCDGMKVEVKIVVT